MKVAPVIVLLDRMVQNTNNTHVIDSMMKRRELRTVKG